MRFKITHAHLSLIYFILLLPCARRKRDRSKAFVMNHMRNVVFAADMENALEMSLDLSNVTDELFNQVPEAYEAFLNYLEVIAELYPAPENSKLGQYLHRLYRYVSRCV